MESKRIVISLCMIMSLGLFLVAINSANINAQDNQTAQVGNNQTQSNQTHNTTTTLLSGTNQTLQENNQSIYQHDQINFTEFFELANTAASRISENNTEQAQQIISEVEQNLNATSR